MQIPNMMVLHVKREANKMVDKHANARVNLGWETLFTNSEDFLRPNLKQDCHRHAQDYLNLLDGVANGLIYF